MLENYFFDKHGLDQQPKVKREKAVAAVLEIIKAGCVENPTHVCISAIKKDVSDAADAIQDALEK